MPALDLESVADQLTMIGLISREQYRTARADAEDGQAESLIRVLLRKGWLTSWQVERLKKGEINGFFYGNYRALFHIAEGTFARVYRGEQNDSKAPVAIKVLRNRFALMPDAVSRFHKEAEAGMRLRHPNIVQLIEQGQQDNHHFMIMEYVEGMNLREFLKLRRRLKSHEAVPLLLGLARGMKYSHDQGVTHRDIKATNILVSNSGEAKLVDFGLATIEGDESKPGQGTASQRTVDYSALERTCGSPKGDLRSDIYFLGCVYYNMLTGQVALEDSESKDPLRKMLRRSFGVIKPLSDHPQAPEEPLARIVDKMMKMDLKLRYQTMGEVINDLEDYQASYDKDAAKAREFSRKYESVQPEEIFSDDDIFVMRQFLKDDEPAKAPEPPPMSPRPEPKPVPSKTILCVEPHAEIQDALRKHLSRMGYRVLLVGDTERAAERYRESTVDGVFFDIDELGHESVNAFKEIHDKALEDGRPLSALVLLGPRQGTLQSKLPSGDHLIVLTKPIKMKQVQEALEQLVPIV